MVHVKVLANLPDNADQGVFFDPDFDIIFLAVPVVQVVGIGGRTYDLARGFPVRIAAKVPGSVFNGVPVDQAR